LYKEYFTITLSISGCFLLNEDRVFREWELKKSNAKTAGNPLEINVFPAVSIRYDSDWARTSDLYPVKVGK